MTYRSAANPHTPQTTPIPGREAEMVKLESGGYAFPADDWARAERFLILGNERGAYYATEQRMTADNAAALRRCIKADGGRLVRLILDISVEGRAAKQEPGIFALALCAAEGDDGTRRTARAVLARVCRTGHALFTFVSYYDPLRGWGRGMRSAVAQWYLGKPVRALAYQLAKYQSRTIGGKTWSHRDVLRLAHPEPTVHPLAQAPALRWAAHGMTDAHGKEGLAAREVAGRLRAAIDLDAALTPIRGLELARKATSEDDIVRLVRNYRLTHEMLPTQWLRRPEVWRALLHEMPMGALLRNLGRLTANGTIGPVGASSEARAASALVCARLRDAERVKRARLHPAVILAADYTYANGRGERGQLFWAPLPEVRVALDAAYEASFGAFTPSGKRILLGVDSSGSMWGGTVAGFGSVAPAEAAAAMAAATARLEPESIIIPFTTNVKAIMRVVAGERVRVEEVRDELRRIQAGEGTDVSAPIRWALGAGLDFDAFVLYTDMQTWAGDRHVVQALAEYRRRRVPNAKLVTVAMVSYGHGLADLTDARSMSVVGLDTTAPRLIADFIADRAKASAPQVSVESGEDGEDEEAE